ALAQLHPQRAGAGHVEVVAPDRGGDVDDAQPAPPRRLQHAGAVLEDAGLGDAGGRGDVVVLVVEEQERGPGRIEREGHRASYSRSNPHPDRRGVHYATPHPRSASMARCSFARRRLVLLVIGALTVVTLQSASAHAQSDVRSPLPAPVKVKQGMTNVPALSPLWLLPEYAAKYNVQIEMVMFQRFADARTALASGDLDITAFGPQDISLALGQGAKSMVGVAGVGSGNDCLIVRKGEDIKD